MSQLRKQRAVTYAVISNRFDADLTAFSLIASDTFVLGAAGVARWKSNQFTKASGDVS